MRFIIIIPASPLDYAIINLLYSFISYFLVKQRFVNRKPFV